MNFFYEDMASNSRSPRNGQDYSGREKDGHDPAGAKPAFASRTDVAMQNISSTIDEISRKAQDLVENINSSRSSDQRVMENFQDELTTKMTEVCQEMKDNMYTIYEDNSSEMHLKLQELTRVLENCSRLHQELTEATQALSGLKVNIAINKQE